MAIIGRFLKQGRSNAVKRLWKYVLCALFVICAGQMFFACDKQEEHICDYVIQKFNKYGHWKECECGSKGEVLEHTFDVSIQDDSTLKTKMICGVTPTQYYYKCSCGALGDNYFELDDKKDYHVLDDNGVCIGCSNTIFKCEHIEVTEIFLDEKDVDCPAMFECNDCNIKYMKSLRYSDMNMPIVNIVGDVASATKENKVNISFNYYGEEEFLDKSGTIKWQGDSSIGFPKKNYSIKLDKKVKINSDWGKQKKYCLKANYNDFSQARNVVSGKLYSQIAKTRDLEDDISKLNNSGVVDGFPILVYQNGVYQGLYTFNIAKDKWMFGMEDSDEKNQAILQTKLWNEECYLRKEITYDLQEGIALEFYSNEESEDDSYEWVVDSFNAMVRFVNDNDGQDFIDGIRDYINVERTIDSFIYTSVIRGDDNIAKNILWVTFDGVKWLPSMYDMDSTWGLYWNDVQPNAHAPFNLSTSYNMLWSKLYANFKSEIETRYKELRQSVLSETNIEMVVNEFFDKIPNIVFETDLNKWNNKTASFVSGDYGRCQMIYWMREHLLYMDSQLSN